MTKIRTVTAFLENIAPLDLQEDYDNSGLITGSEDWEVSGVICSLDSTPAVVQEAIEKGCNLIICHHPIIFSGLKKLSGNTYVERAVVQAIRHDIAIYAIHTNLDNVLQNGVNQQIAHKLDLQDVRILAQREGDMQTGSGVVGELPHVLSPEELFTMVQQKFELEAFRYTPAEEIRSVSRVAVCGGSGSFLLEQAISAGAQVFITADFKYHQFFDADGQIIIMDIGHFESEKFTIQLLYDLISNNFRNFAAQITKVNTNPIRYFVK